jgi:hypothetical protein
MKDLIKQELEKYKLSINEQLEISDTEVVDLIRNYSGSVKFINDLKKKVITNKPLTVPQSDAAKDFFVRERLSTTIESQLDSGKNLGKEVIGLGIETYVNIIKSCKKNLFKSREDITVRISTPGPEWVERNIQDLTNFKEKLSQEVLSKVIELPTKETTTIGAKVEEIINTLERDPNAYPGFIENNGDWSIMNKLDTHYSNWYRILGELDYKKKLVGNTPQKKVENFFKQVPVEEILPPKKVEALKEIETAFNCQIPTLSHADYEILVDFNKDFLNIKKRLMSSTERGDKNEINIKGTLKLFSGGAITDNDIIHFSSHGNRVDQVFGIDMLVYMYLPSHGSEKYWVPIQAKSDKAAANRSMLLKFDIGGISIFPTKNPEIAGNYGYLTVKYGTEKSLDELLQYNMCRKKESSESCKKFDK